MLYLFFADEVIVEMRERREEKVSRNNVEITTSHRVHNYFFLFFEQELKVPSWSDPGLCMSTRRGHVEGPESSSSGETHQQQIPTSQ